MKTPGPDLWAIFVLRRIVLTPQFLIEHSEARRAIVTVALKIGPHKSPCAHYF